MTYKALFERRRTLNVLTDSGMLFLDLEWQDTFVTTKGLPHRLCIRLVAIRIQNLEHFPLGLDVFLVVLEAM